MRTEASRKPEVIEFRFKNRRREAILATSTFAVIGFAMFLFGVFGIISGTDLRQTGIFGLVWLFVAILFSRRIWWPCYVLRDARIGYKTDWGKEKTWSTFDIWRIHRTYDKLRRPMIWVHFRDEHKIGITIHVENFDLYFDRVKAVAPPGTEIIDDLAEPVVAPPNVEPESQA